MEYWLPCVLFLFLVAFFQGVRISHLSDELKELNNLLNGQKGHHSVPPRSKGPRDMWGNAD